MIKRIYIYSKVDIQGSGHFFCEFSMIVYNTNFQLFFLIFATFCVHMI